MRTDSWCSAAIRSPSGHSAGVGAGAGKRDVESGAGVAGDRPVLISITHKLGPQDESEFDIGQPGYAAPHYSVSGRGAFGTRQVAAQSSDLL